MISLASNELMKANTERYLEKLLPQIRIHAEVSVLLLPRDRKVQDAIHETSGDADLVFLGLKVPEAGERERYAERLCELAEPLRTVFFVKNSSLFVGKLIQTTEEIATAAPAEAEKRAGT